LDSHREAAKRRVCVVLRFGSIRSHCQLVSLFLLFLLDRWLACYLSFLCVIGWASSGTVRSLSKQVVCSVVSVFGKIGECIVVPSVFRTHHNLTVQSISLLLYIICSLLPYSFKDFLTDYERYRYRTSRMELVPQCHLPLIDGSSWATSANYPPFRLKSARGV
jgi:hypothetical protein